MIQAVQYMSGSSSGVSFSYNDYDNWNTNSNVSSHLCLKISVLQALATVQKIKYLIKALVTIVNVTL